MVENLDYEKLGLKCGLEIHQQLSTHKLFCNCPSFIRDDKHDVEIKRYLRASAGETGKVDAAAAAEMLKQKYYLYQGYHDSTCLVELDEEPPHPMSTDALLVTLQFCKMVDAKVVDNIRVMRKTVVDGSNTSGFQRTSLVGLGGSILNGRIGIETICLEEDACKIVKRSSECDIYNLSRLGIPLIEIATAPDIRTPDEAKEVAAQIGMLLRSTGKVKRGLGTIRQDVNVSIKDGVRVEIKGAQDLRLIPTYVEYEAMRQKNMLALFKELKKRKAHAEKTIHDISKLFASCVGKVITSALEKKGVVLALKLPGYAGLIGQETQPGRRLGSELSDYAKSQGVKGLFHSDELPKYGITQLEIDAIKKSLKISGNDAFVLIADEKEVAKRALEQVTIRANHLDLIKEVRQARPDGTTQYMRPMPGASRMYPETDIPSVTPFPLKDIDLPELISQKEVRFAKTYKISGDLASQLAKGGYDFDSYVKKFAHVAPTTIADTLVTTPKELKKRFNVEFEDVEKYEKDASVVLEALDAKKISSSSVIDILAALSKGEVIDWSAFKPMDTKALDKIIKEVLAKDPNAPMGALMGMVMKKLGGKADGKLVMQRLNALKK